MELNLSSMKFSETITFLARQTLPLSANVPQLTAVLSRWFHQAKLKNPLVERESENVRLWERGLNIILPSQLLN